MKKEQEIFEFSIAKLINCQCLFCIYLITEKKKKKIENCVLQEIVPPLYRQSNNNALILVNDGPEVAYSVISKVLDLVYVEELLPSSLGRLRLGDSMSL